MGMGNMEIDRRAFIASLGGMAVVDAMDSETKAEALEHYMVEKIDEALGGHVELANAQVLPAAEDATVRRGVGSLFAPSGPADNRKMPALAPMSNNATLLEFFEKRFAPANHVLQSATRALKTGMSEEIVMACLLHDVVQNLVKVDHAWWGAQMLEPYVSEKVSWAIRYHQALRFYPDSAHGYEYPELYNRIYGRISAQPHIKAAYEPPATTRHFEARMITVNDLLRSIRTPRRSSCLDIIGRQFAAEGRLGNDNSPTAHMWRTMMFLTIRSRAGTGPTRAADNRRHRSPIWGGGGRRPMTIDRRLRSLHRVRGVLVAPRARPSSGPTPSRSRATIRPSATVRRNRPM
jgi:hypothetical protein